MKIKCISLLLLPSLLVLILACGGESKPTETSDTTTIVPIATSIPLLTMNAPVATRSIEVPISGETTTGVDVTPTVSSGSDSASFVVATSNMADTPIPLLTATSIPKLVTTSKFTITSQICDDGQGPDCTKLRLGDDYLTASMPAKGYLYSCNDKNPNAPGSIESKITWIDFADKTWNFLKKLWLPQGTFNPESGTYSETISGGVRQIGINNLPIDGNIGDWPMTEYPELTEIDPNPGIPSPSSYSFSYTINPSQALSPTCLSLGAIGVTKNGVVIYNAVDGRGEDAVAREIVDVFGGHPARTEYHYHFIPERLDNEYLNDGHSGIVGYINDGFAIYGYKGESGVEMSNEDLDICHGHEHGSLGYHYHATLEYPYTVGCYSGLPIEGSSGPGNMDQSVDVRDDVPSSMNAQEERRPQGRPDCLPPNPPPGRDNYPPDWLDLDPCL